MKKELINSSNISKFVINQRDRRDIREGKVKELVRQLEEEKHFSAPFVINETMERWRMIDGNHRYEAIKRCLAKNSNFEITVWIAVYRDLTPAEEREVYSLWNIGTVQSSTDFLKAHFQTIPLGREMLRRLPVTIYGDKQHIPIKSLMGCQICAKRRRKFEGGYTEGKEQAIADFREINSEDIDLIEEFCDFMKECFGQYHKGSQFYQTTPLSAFYRIWFDNKSMERSKMVKAFKKVFGANPQNWESWTGSGGRHACQAFYRVAIPSLNGSSTVHFKEDDEALEEHEKEMSIVNLVKNPLQ